MAGRALVRVLLAWSLAACGTTDEGELPPNVQDPATLQNRSGALARYRGALLELAGALDNAVLETGVLTDELTTMPTPPAVGSDYLVLDRRGALAEDQTLTLSDRLHVLRAQAREARGFLDAYVADADTGLSKGALVGHMYALEGYAEVLLADAFCSGIPLSTVDFDDDYSLAEGSTTAEVYRHAIALFDSALALSADSARVHAFASVGRARALLALSRDSAAAAAAAVAAVPTEFSYDVMFGHQLDYGSPAPPDSARLWYYLGRAGVEPGAPTMGEREGANGLDFVSSADPRIAPTAAGQDAAFQTLYLPAKYAAGSPVTFTAASGVEARLIEAEAALQGGDAATWLAKLNALRAAAALPDTADPGDATARVDLLFRERAFWLYLTAHRQGDLRRLVRQYGRQPNTVYPTGPYGGGKDPYEDMVTLPVPASEQRLNPRYSGCIHRNA